MKVSAHFSQCEIYRYALCRTWDESAPLVLMIGLNPSKTEENPTIRRCTNFAIAWGFGGVCVANLFAFRAATPAELLRASDPIGEANDHWLTHLSEKAGLVVAAWGNEGRFLNRSQQVKELLPELHCIQMNKSGEPAHPLYLKSSLTPMRMQGA